MLSFILLRFNSSFISSSHLSHLAWSNQLNHLLFKKRDKCQHSQASTLSPKVSLSKMVRPKKRCLLNVQWMNLKIDFFPSSASCGLLVNIECNLGERSGVAHVEIGAPSVAQRKAGLFWLRLRGVCVPECYRVPFLTFFVSMSWKNAGVRYGGCRNGCGSIAGRRAGIGNHHVGK